MVILTGAVLFIGGICIGILAGYDAGFREGREQEKDRKFERDEAFDDPRGMI